MPKANDKRLRLISAGRKLIYERGYRQSSLADIADAAHVPVGNVYYYFKSKEALIEAVIDARVADFKKTAAAWKALDDPRQRLVSYLGAYADDSAELTRFGCPLGSLSQELNKQQSGLGKKASAIIRLHITWLADQLWELNLEGAQDQAQRLFSSLQGAILIANSQNDAQILNSEIAQLKDWADNL